MLPVLLLLLTFAPLSVAQSPGGEPQSAAAVLRAAIDAMGGEEVLRAIHRVRLEQHGHTNLLEQSERPEGPWIVQYEQRVVELDFERAVARIAVTASGMPGNPGGESKMVFAEGVALRVFGPEREMPDPSLAQEFQAQLELSPPRALLTALAAGDLQVAAPTVLQGTPQQVLTFTWRGVPARLVLNAATHLPTAVEWVRADPTSFFFGVWGDVTTRVAWSFWHLERGGLRLPRQLDIEKNGQPWQSSLSVQLELEPVVEPVAISEAAKTAFAAQSARTIQDQALGKRVCEIGPGVVQLLNGWNVTLVRQDDGVVVLEAPYSAGYSERVLAEVERRFPGEKVKAVVTASDAWPHLGGVRGYVARGIPVYVLDLNQPILDRLVAAPFEQCPDTLAKHPAKPEWRVVRGKTVIGQGHNVLELHPLRTETGERMLMAWLPELRALYAADLVQPMGKDVFFMPQYLAEVREAVRRENLEVASVFAMHAPLLPWSAIEAAIAGVTAKGQ